MFESPILQIERLILFPEREKKEQVQAPAQAHQNNKEFEALLPVVGDESRRPRRSTRINESVDEADVKKDAK